MPKQLSAILTLAIIFAIFLFGFGLGLLSGLNIGQKWIKADAVKQNLAVWKVSPEGNAVFKWKCEKEE